MMLRAMKTMTLLKVWIVLTLGWLFLLGPAMVEWYREEQRTGTVSGALWKSVWMIVLTLVSALVIHVLYRRGVSRHSGEMDGGLRIDASPTRVLPGVAQGVGALGVTFLVGQLPRPACGGIVLGLLLTAAGAFLLRRELLRIEPGERRLLRVSHLFGHPLKTSELVLAAEKPIRLERLYRRGVVLLVGSMPLAEGLEHVDAVRIAGALGPALGREVKDNTVHAPERSSLVRGLGGLSRLPGIALLLLLVGLGAVWMVPAGRSALCRLAVAPHPPFAKGIR